MSAQQRQADQKTQTAHEIFGDHLTEFRRHLVENEYSGNTIQSYFNYIGALAEVMMHENVPLSKLDASLALVLIKKSERISTKGMAVVYMTRRFVRFLHQNGAGNLPPPPTEKEAARAALRRDYEDYLSRQRGLSERTIFSCWHQANRFLEYRFGEDAGDLSTITVTDITDFLLHVTGRKPPIRNKTVATHLRSFFRFLFQTRRHEINLAKNVPSVAQRYGKRLPGYLSPEQTRVLVEAVRNEKPTSRRNYAMVLLLARLGLRPQEIIRMCIDDIDWRSGEIVIRGKGNRHDRMPLPSDVGEALVDYIRQDRVTKSRVLFVSCRAPHKPFKDASILNTVLREAFAKSGLTPPMSYTCTYILRHSLATNLVRKGASLDEVSNLLRHRSRSTTMLYARMDVEGLRSIALPWPEEGGAQ